MSEDVYVYEAISVNPPITEAEVGAGIASGDYQKVAWEDDGRTGDGYFVKVGVRGMIGVAMVPELDENGTLRHRGVAIEANPLDADHRDSTIEAELRRIVADFGAAPDGTLRIFERAIYIEKSGVEDKVFVREGEVIRTRAEPAGAAAAGETMLTLAITKYEADLLRQMVALDIHDHNATDAPVDSRDPGFNQRRVDDCRALLAKLNDLLS
ncbi:hypothetical protein LO763_10035 [Glycomyces sp. A-F 0318]|uniref:hypothetical protein n=1 Tax=Glycomyces amatae TaxID=2881355 RepID=UPI001E4DC2CF|nr:hypothetical protein [Glycomyces amatae]MCD0443962.1 hypothetical protein [Glycomyces amatae]